LLGRAPGVAVVFTVSAGRVIREQAFLNNAEAAGLSE
jgi:hypothetical protein